MSLLAAYLHSQAWRSLLNSGSHVVLKDIVMKGRRYWSISSGHERTFMSFATLTPAPKLFFCTLKDNFWRTSNKRGCQGLPDNPRHPINMKITAKTLKCQMNFPSQMCLCPQITQTSGQRWNQMCLIGKSELKLASKWSNQQVQKVQVIDSTLRRYKSLKMLWQIIKLHPEKQIQASFCCTANQLAPSSFYHRDEIKASSVSQNQKSLKMSIAPQRGKKDARIRKQLPINRLPIS